MKIITITNQKGGVGKTTTAINLAATLARNGKHTLLADLDPQGNATTFLGAQPAPGAYLLLAAYIPNLAALITGDISQQIKSRLIQARENLDILPGNMQTAVAQNFMLQGERDLTMLRRAITEQFREYDFVILDTAPSVGGILELATWAADKVIIPTACETGSIEGLLKTIETLKALTARNWSGQLTGILPTFFDEMTKERRETLAHYNRAFPEVCLSPIHESTALRELPNNQATIFEKAEAERGKKSAQRATQEFEALARTILRR